MLSDMLRQLGKLKASAIMRGCFGSDRFSED